MGNVGALIFYSIIGVLGLYFCLHGIICVLKGKINHMAFYYGQKGVISLKKNPFGATVTIVVYLILALLCLIVLILQYVQYFYNIN